MEFARADCRPCPVRAQCTTAKRGFRSLSIHPDPDLHATLRTARATQHTPNWERKYALRAGIEGTINQALDVTDLRQARYRGLRKTRLQHAFSAAALNLIRLDAYWNDPAPRPRHTTRLIASTPNWPPDQPNYAPESPWQQPCPRRRSTSPQMSLQWLIPRGANGLMLIALRPSGQTYIFGCLAKVNQDTQ